jgi:hypothetical protein
LRRNRRTRLHADRHGRALRALREHLRAAKRLGGSAACRNNTRTWHALDLSPLSNQTRQQRASSSLQRLACAAFAVWLVLLLLAPEPAAALALSSG